MGYAIIGLLLAADAALIAMGIRALIRRVR
jgi:hypothetical protein